MRGLGLMVAGSAMALAIACGAGSEPRQKAASAPSFSWRPTPVADAPDPTETVKNAPATDWRAVDPANLMIVDLADGTRFAVELASGFAPVHVANIRAFARGGFWDKGSVYRVQENWVVQWGNNEAPVPLPAGAVAKLPNEYDRSTQGLAIRPLGYPDAYAPMVGHSGGWPVAYDPQSGRAWLTHCYAMVGVARDVGDPGNSAELYAVSGHAPRQLDANLSIVGRVIDGMEPLARYAVGTEAMGFYKAGTSASPIARVRIAADIPAAERPAYEVMRTDSASFNAFVTGRANRHGGLYERTAGGVDICNAPVPTRKKP